MHTNFNKDLRAQLPELEHKIKRLQWRFNMSIGWQLDEAVDELAEKFLALIGHPNFDPGDSTDVLAHLYNLNLQDIWSPLESLLYNTK